MGDNFILIFADLAIHYQKVRDEKMQTRTLFSVVALFLVGHFFRIFNDIKELYDMLKVKEDPYLVKDCNRGCASTFSLWSNVSISYETNFYNGIYELKRYAT